MKGVVFAATIMCIVVGVDLIAVAPGYWWIVGDVMLLVGLLIFSAMTGTSWD